MSERPDDRPPDDILGDDDGAVSGRVLHGGEGDPLGGGQATLEDSDDVTEGIPDQDGGST